MELGAYLKEKRVKQNEFARLVGTSQAAISQILNKKTRPDPNTALRIERATNGEVKARDLRPDLAEIFGSERAE